MSLHTCIMCEKKYSYCPNCEVRSVGFDKSRFCSKEHSDIYYILCSQGAGSSTTEETLEKLKAYDLSVITNESILKHIDSLKPKKVRKPKKAIESEKVSEETEQE